MPFLKVKTNDAWVPVGWTERVVDDALSTTSTNPVQNKIVSSAVATLYTDMSNKIDSAVASWSEALDEKADENHTHNYAGSSSAGGAATSANKVNSSLSISLNGTSAGTFNGSSNVTVNVTPSSIGAVTMDCSNISGATSANKIIVSKSEPTVENGAIWVNPTPIIDTGWQEVALNTADFKAYNDVSSNAPIYRRVGDMVQIKGIVSPVSASNSLGSGSLTEIGTIPNDCVPSSLAVYAVCHGSDAAVWMLKVSLDGTIGATKYASGNTFITPGTNAWMAFSVTYLI